MIVFDLKCQNGHSFEGWFSGVEDFEDQLEKGLIACPVCQDVRITRLLSTFAMRSAQKPSDDPSAGQQPNGKVEAMARQWIRQVSEYLNSHFENVGSNFATEALKIHYGVKEARNIRGTSTKAEEEMLQKEGVEFMKVPVLAKDDGDA